MGATKWTPGPWGAKQNELELGIYGWDVASSHILVAHVYQGGPTKQRAKANAHLIAASPDLAEALERCVLTLEEQEPVQFSHAYTALKEARAALARARGDS